jgi:hypothetical protein
MMNFFDVFSVVCKYACAADCGTSFDLNLKVVHVDQSHRKNMEHKGSRYLGVPKNVRKLSLKKVNHVMEIKSFIFFGDKKNV